MKKLYLIVLTALCVSSQVLSQGCPTNLGFELNDFTNWICGNGRISSTTTSVRISLSNTTPITNIHTILNPATTSGTDFYGGFPVICPFTGNTSVKIGNATGGAKAHAIAYQVAIPANATNFSLKIYYAIVLGFPRNHSVFEQPRFAISVTDANGQQVGSSCNNFLVTPLSGNFGWLGSPISSFGDSVYYKPWTVSTINLSKYGGQTVTVRFTTTDCSLGAHLGYAYVDVGTDCTSATSISAGYCKGETKPIIAAPTGYQSYAWWDSLYTNPFGTTEKITLNNPSFTQNYFYVDVTPAPGQGCRDTIKVTVKQNPKPTVKAISGDSVICGIKTGQVTNSTSGYNGALPNVWSLSDTSRATINASTGLITGKNTATSGTSTVKYVYADSATLCKDSVTFRINISKADSVRLSVSVSPSTTISAGSTATFTASTTNAGTNPSFTWYRNGSIVGGKTNTYSTNTLNDGDSVWCMLASTNSCAYNPTVTSSNIKMKVTISNTWLVSGRVVTPNNNPVNTATVNAKGTTSTNTSSNASGTYALNLNKNGNYVLNVSKNNDAAKLNGVTTVDVALIQSHLLQQNLLNSPYKIIAADVNSDNVVSTRDIIFLRRFILGTDTVFPGNKLWNFVDSSYVFPNATNPFPYKDSIVLTGLSATRSNQTFIGVKLGDVNWDRNSNLNKQSSNTSTTSNLLSTKAITVIDESTIQIPLTLSSLQSFIGLQFALKLQSKNWVAYKIESKYLKQIVYNKQSLQEGIVKLLWNDEANRGLQVKANDEVITITCKKVQNDIIDNTISVELLPELMTSELVNENLEAHNISMNKTTLVVPVKTIPSENSDIVIYPNPAKDFITIKSANLQQVNILDGWGKLVLTTTATTQKPIQITSLKKGIYWLQLIHKDKIQTVKLIKE